MKKNGISRTLLRMTVMPLIMLGVVITIFSIFAIRASLEESIQRELQNYAHMIADNMDTLYPGDYAMIQKDDTLILSKGDVLITDNDLLISWKRNTNVDFTIFYQDTRVLTTVVDHTGTLIVGTKASYQLKEDVLNHEQDLFYDNLKIGDTMFYGYYLPLYNNDNKCIGMIAALMPKELVYRLVIRAILPILLLTIIVMMFVGIWTKRHADIFLSILDKLRLSLSRAAKGELSNTVSPDVLSRKDEFSDMGYSIIEMQKSLRELIEQDPLTKLFNRRSGQAHLQKAFERYQEENRVFYVALGDIDHFKIFNDLHGHACGDVVLQSMAQLMQETAKFGCHVIRWGGEEFLIYMPVTQLEEAAKIMNHLIDQIRNKIVVYEGEGLSVTMTFGLCSCENAATLDDLIIEVDDLLYEGKKNGRNQLVVHEP